MEEEKDSLLVTFFAYVFAIAIFVGAGMLLRPSDSRHREKIMDELRVTVKKELKKEGDNALKQGDLFTYGVDKAAMKKDEAIDALIEDKWDIDVDNYLIFSLGKVKESETNESKTVSIGVCGFVFVRDIPFNW